MRNRVNLGVELARAAEVSEKLGCEKLKYLRFPRTQLHLIKERAGDQSVHPSKMRMMRTTSQHKNRMTALFKKKCQSSFYGLKPSQWIWKHDSLVLVTV